MNEERKQWYEYLQASEEHRHWLRSRGLMDYRQKSWWLHAAIRAARRADPNISAAEFMATIKYTSDVDQMTPAERVRYERIKYGDPTWSRRGYG
jgi:hypothetical protein